jgi:hypothetical protein
MTPRKSQRAPKPITVREEKKAPLTASDPKITNKTARNQPETALKPTSRAVNGCLLACQEFFRGLGANNAKSS